KVHDDDREKQSERDRRRYNDCAANVAEKQILNQEKQHDPKHQIVKHRAGGDVDQLASIVIRLDPNSVGKHSRFVYRYNLGFDSLDDFKGLLAPAHEHDPFDYVVVAVTSCEPQSLGVSDFRLSHVL